MAQKDINKIMIKIQGNLFHCLAFSDIWVIVWLSLDKFYLNLNDTDEDHFKSLMDASSDKILGKYRIVWPICYDRSL